MKFVVVDGSTFAYFKDTLIFPLT